MRLVWGTTNHKELKERERERETNQNKRKLRLGLIRGKKWTERRQKLGGRHGVPKDLESNQKEKERERGYSAFCVGLESMENYYGTITLDSTHLLFLSQD